MQRTPWEMARLREQAERLIYLIEHPDQADEPPPPPPPAEAPVPEPPAHGTIECADTGCNCVQCGIVRNRYLHAGHPSNRRRPKGVQDRLHSIPTDVPVHVSRDILARLEVEIEQSEYEQTERSERQAGGDE